MAAGLLYSTNPKIKKLIAEQFFGGSHYVWCSQVFSTDQHAPNSWASFGAPSSDPYRIYQALKKDVKGADAHSEKIRQTKASLRALVVQWETSGTLSLTACAEIAYLLERDNFHLWEPLLYVIPTASIDVNRIKLVDPTQRASFVEEFIIADLKSTECDFLEW